MDAGMKRMHIGLVYDLRSDYLAEGYTEEQVAEFDFDATLDALEKGIRSLGYRTDRIGHARALCRRLVKGDRWDLVFTIAEGVQGRSREAQVPCLLELYGIPYTFSDPLTCAITLDKAATKRLVQAAGLPTPAFAVVAKPADCAGVRLRYPLFAKPLAEGTGKGVDTASRIDTPQALLSVCRRLIRRFAQPVLVEEYLPGREFTTAVLGTGAAARVLGTMEVRIKADTPTRDYSYAIKEQCEQYVEYGPPEHGTLRRKVEALALAAHRALECRDASRSDVRLDHRGRPSFMEINPLPGLHPQHSDLPMIATQEGMRYRELLARIIGSAVRRYGLR